MSNISAYTDSEVVSLRKIEKDTSFTLGQYGAVYEGGTDAVTGNFGCITALEDAVFSSLTASNWTGDNPASLPLKAGVTIFGTFTGFTLTSGKVVAYNAAS
jgi:hypothetical protein